MRRLTQEYRLVARTAREVYEAMVNAVASASARVKFRGRKVGNEAFINAAVMWLLDQAPAEREKILAEYVGRFEALMATDPSEGPPGGEQPGGWRPVGIVNLDPPPKPSVGDPKRKHKGPKAVDRP